MRLRDRGTPSLLGATLARDALLFHRNLVSLSPCVRRSQSTRWSGSRRVLSGTGATGNRCDHRSRRDCERVGAGLCGAARRSRAAH